MILSILASPLWAIDKRSEWIQIDHLKNCHKHLSKDSASGISKSIEKWSKKYKIDADWMTGLYAVESHFDTNSTDGRDSWGIPQLQTNTAQLVVDKWKQAYKVTPEELKRCSGLAIRISCCNFRALLVEFGGDYVKATRAYNAGSTNVKRGHFLGRRPCVPGMNYCSKVLKAYWQYEIFKLR